MLIQSGNCPFCETHLSLQPPADSFKMTTCPHCQEKFILKSLDNIHYSDPFELFSNPYVILASMVALFFIFLVGFTILFASDTDYDSNDDPDYSNVQGEDTFAPTEFNLKDEPISTIPVAPPAPRPDPKPTPPPAKVTPPKYTCNCSKTCPNISTCEEAFYLLEVCGCYQRDADNDGIPCDAMCQ